MATHSSSRDGLILPGKVRLFGNRFFRKEKPLTYWYLIAGIIVLAGIVKFFENRMPHWMTRIVILTYVTVPLTAIIWAMVIAWKRGFGTTELVLFAVFSLLTGIGTGVGYHRLLTHRSFETIPPIRFLFVMLGAMAIPTRPIDFAANHLKHHAFSDEEGDPHSPIDGMFHAHIGWVLEGKRAEREKYCKRLLNDKLIMFIDRTTFVWFGIGLLIPYLIAGWEGLLWGGFIRVAYHNHVTFSVNSICHTFGKRPFQTKDESRNNWIVGLLAFGEGWHHNHHAFPAMAVHGMGWRQFDLNGLVIKALQRLRLAWDVKQPSAELIARRRVAPVERQIRRSAIFGWISFLRFNR